MKYNNFQPWGSVSKLPSIIILLFAVSMSSSAQTSVAVAPIKMNVFFIGVENPVAVAASGATDDKVTVSVNGGGGSATRVSAGNYIVRVTEITDDCTIHVEVDGKLAGTSKFRVRKLPAPMGTIGGFSSGANVPSDVFRRQAGLGLYVQDFPFDIKYDVLNYTITVEDDNGGVKAADNQGASFSTEARQYIDQYVKPGKTVTVDNIRVKDPGGRELKIPSLLYYIK